MDEDLYQIIYASVESQPMSEGELVKLLRLAREKNSKLGITGMLLHCDGTFIQALEGPTQVVKQMIDIIQKDSRHHSIVKLFEGPVRERTFSQWSMGFRRPSKEELAGVEGYTPFLEVGDDPQAIQRYSSVAMKLLKTFRDISDQRSSSS